MGVPRFYRWITGRYAGINDVIPSERSAMMFDLASLIHQSFQEVFGYGNVDRRTIKQAGDRLERGEYQEMVSDAIDTLIINISSIIHANDSYPNTVVFAMDGPPPHSKLIQQRQRRYGPENERFDTNLITPGTPLMKKIDERLNQWITNNREALPPRIIYSDYMHSGEGEHKLFDLLRNYSFISGPKVIYGQDADLIILSLLHDEVNEIYMLRDKDDDNGINIDTLRSSILEDGWNSIDDFLVATTLLGNDFLPIPLSMRDLDKAMDYIIEHYDPEQPLVINEQIDIDNLREFITRIANHEDEYIKELEDKVPWVEANINNPINNYREYMIENDTEDITIEELTKQYITGIYWVYKYYKGFSIDWDWYYPGHYAPLITDLIDSRPVKKYVKRTGTRITQQLLTVIPPRSINEAFPDNLKQQLEDIDLTPINDIFVNDYIVDESISHKEMINTQSVRLIPLVNPRNIRRFIERNLNERFNTTSFQIDERESIDAEPVDEQLIAKSRKNVLYFTERPKQLPPRHISCKIWSNHLPVM